MDHYAQLLCHWQDLAQHWDYEERYQALSLPGYCSGGPLPLRYFGVPYHLDPKSGAVTRDKDGQPAEFFVAMAIYALFFYSQPRPRCSGNFVAFRQISQVAPFTSAFEQQWVQPFSLYFGGKTKLLRQLGLDAGFLPLAHSDAGFEARAFDCLPLRYLFWDGDEEFPPQTTVLFDANITQFVHPEMVVCIGGEGLKLLRSMAEERRLSE